MVEHMEVIAKFSESQYIFEIQGMNISSSFLKMFPPSLFFKKKQTKVPLKFRTKVALLNTQAGAAWQRM